MEISVIEYILSSRDDKNLIDAEIIKISSPDKPDIVADYPPYTENKNLSANQAWLGRTKKNLFLNLKTQEGVDIVKKLVKEYDIVIEQHY